MTLPQNLRSLSPAWIFALGLLGAGFVGFCDWVLPFAFTLSLFYFAPIIFVAWNAGRRAAIAMAVICTAIWWVSNLQSQPFTLRAYSWTAVNRLGAFMIGAFGGAAMRNQRLAMRARIEAMERTRELEEEIVRVSESEQMRIGQDLHDGLCQQLAAIDCAMACLRQDLEDQGSGEAKAAGYIQERLVEAIREARDMARGVFPVQVNEEGFLAALQELVAQTRRLRHFNVQLGVHGDVRIKNPQTGMHLYRIAQEALSNAAKHAQAKEVRIELERNGPDLTMSVADDGVGLSSERSQNGGIGLHTMSYRARSMGGTLELVANPTGGTVVRCRVRMAPEEALGLN